ncbi:MAG TPA: hypothetical protein VFR68_02745 [Candidatus Dormibacteraeota bacterium]|nr:hypothetical protein [Candidatus Dormibacteraeota bacterium]
MGGAAERPEASRAGRRIAADDPYGPKSIALIERFAKTAASYGWVATGGDDFHGPTVTPLIRLAEWTATPASCVDDLLARRP